MDITDKRIDGGKPFDWGRTSADYARYRDIYPDEFYAAVTSRGLCTDGQRVLDVGTGTGVLPRNMYRFGAKWTGADISEEQIAQAKRLTQEGGMDIDFVACPTEKLSFPDQSFDVITACQCFWYFDHKITSPLFSRMLVKGGRLLVLYMAWLPFEDAIAGESEKLVLGYNPDWTGAGETMHPIFIPDEVKEYFEPVYSAEKKLMVRFTKESWHGRMRACRGVGASLSGEQLAAWEADHRALLDRIAPDEFDILHYMAIAELKKR